MIVVMRAGLHCSVVMRVMIRRGWFGVHGPYEDSQHTAHSHNDRNS